MAGGENNSTTKQISCLFQAVLTDLVIENDISGFFLISRESEGDNKKSLINNILIKQRDLILISLKE